MNKSRNRYLKIYIFLFSIEQYHNQSQSLAYFQSGDSYYWYEGKQLNSTHQPEVYILKESQDRKKIVIKCPLRSSDVASSLNGLDAKSFHSAQSHPLVSNKVTVSAFHVKLALLDVQEFSQNPSFIDFSSRSFISNTLFKNKPAPERYLLFYDSKCRHCQVNTNYESFDPFRAESILCSLKVKCRFQRAQFKYESV